MRYIYHPDALTEYADAALYYGERVPGLGADFTREIEAAIDCIQRMPECSLGIDGDVRRYLVRRFPYGILYTIEDSYFMIVAVMHLSRKPGYWRHRISLQ